MDDLFRALFALVAALNAATGAPIDADQMPDRPPIVAPTFLPLPVVAATDTPLVERTVELQGALASVQGNLIVVNGQRIVLGPSSRIQGTLRVGALIKVQATSRGTDGLEARSVEVTDDEITATSTLQVQVQPTEKPEVQATESPEVQPTEKPEVRSTETPEVKPTEKPEVRSTETPEAQPTEKP